MPDAVRRPRYIHLSFLLVAAPLSGAALCQEDPVLEAVRITAARAQGFVPNTVEAGSFRGGSIMDAPSTVNVVTREVLELQAAGGLYDALRNTAGVTRQQNAGDTWDQLVIRGIAVENRTNYRLNGSLPIMNFSQVAMENKERVEVLKGASALYYGFTTPAGVVNFVTRRAGAAPVSSIAFQLDDNGSAVVHADLARRFGAANEFGLRVNVAGGALGSHLDGVDDGRRRFASAAFDWRATPRLLLKADLEYDRRRVTEQAGVALPAAANGAIPLPRAVDPRRLVGPAGAVFDARVLNAQLRADYALGDAWALTVEAGRSQTERDRSLPIFRFNSNAAVATGAGRINGNLQTSIVASELLRAELAGSFATGAIRHELTLGATRTVKTQDPIYQRSYLIAAQNLYQPRPAGAIVPGAAPAAPTSAALASRDAGLYALDRMALGAQWQLVAGLRRAGYRSEQGTARYDAAKTAPMAALVYKAAPQLSFYASAAQGLEEGEAGPAGTVNQGERLAPGVSRQRELGGRWRAPGGTLLSAALFDIARPGYYTNAANRFVADGWQRYRGLELSTQGQLTRRLAWQTSAQWLDPRFRGIGAAYDGKLPENAARQTGSAFLSYTLDAVPGLSLNGGAYFTGKRPVNDLDQAWLGGTTLFAAGARYAAPVWGKRATWQINVENAGGKQYWAAGGTRLSAGLPRTVKLGVKLDL
ncbi:TonB-dependent siderophore receptor [Pseudoduganella sp. LjRoot289]|uniref:TonB-dependent siderophore receptor n=1 Tax=Pseudoduganella sp. LjRoot289 TaxID=3342314 RepID=UPI003ED0F287